MYPEFHNFSDEPSFRGNQALSSSLREEFDLTSVIPVFDQGDPFRNIVIDNFLRDDVAKAVAEEFPEFNGPEWAAAYDNPIEVKKALNHWTVFRKIPMRCSTS